MVSYPSIYAVVVFDLHPKVKEFIDQLNQDGQIDLDPTGYPYLIKCDRQGANFVVQISRNNRIENFVLNPRKKVAPVCSWNPNDGFVRAVQKQTMVMQPPIDPGRERARRDVSISAIESLVEFIMR